MKKVWIQGRVFVAQRDTLDLKKTEEQTHLLLRAALGTLHSSIIWITVVNNYSSTQSLFLDISLDDTILSVILLTIKGVEGLWCWTSLETTFNSCISAVIQVNKEQQSNSGHETESLETTPSSLHCFHLWVTIEPMVVMLSKLSILKSGS